MHHLLAAPDLWQQLSNPVFLYVCVLTRIGAALMMLPAIGDRTVPMRVRALLAILLTVVAAPVVPAVVAPSGTAAGWGMALAREMALGMTAGLLIRILLTASSWAGQAIDQLGGLGLGAIADPNFGETASVFARLLDLSMIAIFLAIGGHRAVVAAVLESLRQMPPGHLQWPDSALPWMVEVLGASTALGLRVAAPVLAALLLATLVTGIISRTLPQFNILAVGFGLNALVALLALWASIGLMGGVLQAELDEVLRWMGRLASGP